MENNNNWENFWKEWRTKEVETEDDLYFQVGKTVNKKPIDREVFNKLTRNIISRLSLNQNDILVELCCGNGLCTYELKDQVKQIMAVDFAPHLIEAAKKFKSASNISYTLGSAFDFVRDFRKHWDVTPTKYLMNDSIPHFTPDDLKGIIADIIVLSGGSFVFMITGAPNDHLKSNFYNTEERMKKYLDNLASGNKLNDGVGRWWAPEEFEQLCKAMDLKCSVINQPAGITNFRMDIVISSKDR